MTMTNVLKKIIGSLAILSLLTFGASTSFAGSITVTNENEATITNEVTASASSGGNSSRGERGGNGGDGGDSDSGENGSGSAGDGGMGGGGGNGGAITTGNTIATVEISNDVNTTDTRVEDRNTNANKFNETSSVRSNIGSSFDIFGESVTRFEDNSSQESSSSSSESSDESSSEASNSASSESEDEDTSTTTSSSSTASDEEASESSSSSSQESTEESSQSSTNAVLATTRDTYAETGETHDILETDYTRTYAGGDDNITVRNSNNATVTNAMTADARSGNNTSVGSLGGNGSDGGDSDSDGSSATTTDDGDGSGGNGGDGGRGGNGGEVNTGVSDSLVRVVSTSGRTMTRVIRD